MKRLLLFNFYVGFLLVQNTRKKTVPRNLRMPPLPLREGESTGKIRKHREHNQDQAKRQRIDGTSTVAIWNGC